MARWAGAGHERPARWQRRHRWKSAQPSVHSMCTRVSRRRLQWSHVMIMVGAVPRCKMSSTEAGGTAAAAAVAEGSVGRRRGCTAGGGGGERGRGRSGLCWSWS